MELSPSDLAKYPFVPKAAKYIESLDLRTDELSDSKLERILKRAEARIETAILSDMRGEQLAKDEAEIDEVEIPSFPIAVMMLASTQNSQLKRRFALAEAKRASSLLGREDDEKVETIGRIFKWRIRPTKRTSETLAYDFVLHFSDYLRNATSIQDAKWKLANRLMLNGGVYISKIEASRLLQEEVRSHVEERLNIKVGELPKHIIERVDRVTRLFYETRGKIQTEELPSETLLEAFPPCMRQLYNMAPSGRHISHMGRFALTSFLLNSGMPAESIIEHFRPTSDFSERMTRYQVEHIAGGRGSRTKYVPPRCDTLRTHGICPGVDDACRRVKNPFTYYRNKLRTIKTQSTAKP